MSNDRLERFKYNVKAGSSFKLQNSQKHVVKNYINRYDFISLKYFNGIARVLEIQVNNKTVNSCSTNDNANLSLQYLKISNDDTLSLYLSKIDSTLKIPVELYKSHVAVNICDGIMKLARGFDNLVKRDSKIMFAPTFYSHITNNTNSKTNKRNKSKIDEEENDDEDYVPPGQAKKMKMNDYDEDLYGSNKLETQQKTKKRKSSSKRE